jgi:hypothetical protein
LDVDEVNKYLVDSLEYKALCSWHLLEKIDDLYRRDDACFWRIRSPGYKESYAGIIRPDGRMDIIGDSVGNSYTNAVRPAMWVSIDVLDF